VDSRGTDSKEDRFIWFAQLKWSGWDTLGLGQPVNKTAVSKQEISINPDATLFLVDC